MASSRRLVLASSLLGFVVLLLTFKQSSTEAPATEAPKVKVESPAANVVATQDAQFLKRLDATNPKPAVDADRPRQDALLASFKRWHAMSNYFNRDALRRAELRELLEDSANLEIAFDTVTDLDEARALYGEDQAIARVYSIKMLAEAARAGNDRPLRDAIKTLTVGLDEVVKAGKGIQKAQDRDLADLLDVAVTRVDGATLKADLRTVLAELGYRPDLAPEVRKPFDDAVFFPLLGEVGREEAARIVTMALAETSAY